MPKRLVIEKKRQKHPKNHKTPQISKVGFFFAQICNSIINQNFNKWKFLTQQERI